MTSVNALSGQTAVVVGGSSGIGLATAQALLAQGATVTIVSRSSERLAKAGEVLGSRVSRAPVDCADEVAAAAFFEGFPNLDHLVISLAGGAALGPFTETPVQGVRETFDGKFWPYLIAMHHGAKRLSDHGTMTLVTGASAIAAVPTATALGAVNGALEGVIKTLSVELAPRRVNAVSPGLTDTEAWSRIPDDIREGMYAQSAADTPVGRIGQPEDVADAVLACIQNGFLTGLVLPCDGGKRLV
ncbi:MAG: SDR family oxidoreductase [Rhodospirillaceae bacterium]|nr:SDR family oxidoreductase [Rhodospirillaceae bacterium]